MLIPTKDVNDVLSAYKAGFNYSRLPPGNHAINDRKYYFEVQINNSKQVIDPEKITIKNKYK